MEFRLLERLGRLILDPRCRRGGVAWAALDVLRAADRSLTWREITERMKAKGVTEPTPKQPAT